MIKNYSIYIKESIQFEDPPPFNLKNFNPKNDVFDYYKHKYGVEKPFQYGEWCEMYLEYMKKIMKPGKYIIFLGHRPGMSEGKFKGYIKKVLQPDSNKAIIHIILDDNIEYGLFPNDTVKIYDKEPEIIFNELDPYGEEEWDD